MSFFQKRVLILIVFTMFSFNLWAVTEEEREEYIRHGFETTYLPHMFQLEENPQIFVSYAWGENARIDFVQRVGRDLKRMSQNALLDIDDNPPSTRIIDFVSRVSASKYVLLFGSEQYRAKWNDRETYRSVLVEEAGLIEYKKRSDIDSVLGIQLNGGRREDVFPEFMYQVVTIDARTTDYYETFKSIANILWQKEERRIEDFDKNWTLFEKYKASILSGEKDDEVTISVDYKQRAQERMETRIERIHFYQAHLQEEEEQREVERAQNFLE